MAAIVSTNRISAKTGWVEAKALPRGSNGRALCRTCGIESFARGSDGKGNELVMINVNCLEDAPPIDRAAIKHWDGANW